MAVRPVADNCMFCMNLPCTCEKLKTSRPRKKAAPTSTAPVVTSAPPPVTRPVEAPGKVGPSEVFSGAESPFPKEKSARPNLSTVARVRDAGDEAMSKAVTLFAQAFLIHHEDLRRLKPMINLPEHEIDAMIWRQENAESVRSRTNGTV